MSRRRAWDPPKPQLARTSPKKAAAVKADALTRTDVWRRQQGMCVCCGGQLGVSWHLHHRQLKGQGGDDSLSNLIGLLGTHHMQVHDHVQRSYDHGYLVKSHDDPAAIPLRLFDGRLVWLTADGRYLNTKEAA